MKLGIFLPTYKRSHTLQKVATNIENATRSEFKLYFGLEPHDLEGIQAAKATGHEVVINKYDQGYSNTIQTIYEQSNEPVIFHANDDFEFYDGWDMKHMELLHLRPEVMVLGAHDGMEDPSYSTISFIRREYIEKFSGVIDMPNRVFYPYNHNYVDTEFTLTAQARGVWDRLETPCIKHHRVGGDETYSKNDATSPVDAKTFASREHLWANINKEDYMPKPLSEEEKKQRSERMKLFWKNKRDTTQDTEIINKTDYDNMAEVINHINKAVGLMITVRDNNQDAIECVETLDALLEAQKASGRARGSIK